MVSGFVALTLSPMMCSLLLKHETKHRAGLPHDRGRLQAARPAATAALLAATLQRPLPGDRSSALGVAGGERLCSRALKSELAPIEDRGLIDRLGIAPEGSTPQYTGRYARPDRGMYAEVPEMAAVLTTVVSRTSRRVDSTRAGSRTGRSASASSRRSPTSSAASCAASPACRVSPSTRPRSARARRPAGRVRAADLAAPTPSCKAIVDALLAEARENPGADQPRHRPQAQQARAPRPHQPRQGRRHRRRRRRSSAARSRRCSAAARSRASRRTASSTT